MMKFSFPGPHRIPGYPGVVKVFPNKVGPFEGIFL